MAAQGTWAATAVSVWMLMRGREQGWPGNMPCGSMSSTGVQPGAAALQRLGRKVSGISIREAVSVSGGCACCLLLLIEPPPRETPVDLVSGHRCGNTSS